jgi:hypothetical protein
MLTFKKKNMMILSMMLTNSENRLNYFLRKYIVLVIFIDKYNDSLFSHLILKKQKNII